MPSAQARPPATQRGAGWACTAVSRPRPAPCQQRALLPPSLGAQRAVRPRYVCEPSGFCHAIHSEGLRLRSSLKTIRSKTHRKHWKLVSVPAKCAAECRASSTPSSRPRVAGTAPRDVQWWTRRTQLLSLMGKAQRAAAGRGSAGRGSSERAGRPQERPACRGLSPGSRPAGQP